MCFIMAGLQIAATGVLWFTKVRVSHVFRKGAHRSLLLSTVCRSPHHTHTHTYTRARARVHTHTRTRAHTRTHIVCTFMCPRTCSQRRAPPRALRRTRPQMVSRQHSAHMIASGHQVQRHLSPCRPADSEVLQHLCVPVLSRSHTRTHTCTYTQASSCTFACFCQHNSCAFLQLCTLT